jgi:hypothetical protein
MGLFSSQFWNFGRLLPLEAEIGRGLCGRGSRPLFISSRCVCGAAQAGDCPACAHGGLS